MFPWMDKEGIYIRHLINTGEEYCIGLYFCDGYDHVHKTMFEFDGSWYHGHKCRLTTKAWGNFPKLMSKRQNMIQDKETSLKEQGFKVDLSIHLLSIAGGPEAAF